MTVNGGLAGDLRRNLARLGKVRLELPGAASGSVDKVIEGVKDVAGKAGELFKGLGGRLRGEESQQ